MLYQEYSPRIHRFAISYLKSESDAEELVQEVFMRLWEKRMNLQESGNIRAYIFKIAANCIYDLIRKKNVQQAFFDFISDKSLSSDNTWQEVVFQDMHNQINSLIKQLTPQQQRIFQLSKFEGLSNDEIAKKLQLSKRTIENQLYRAVAFLKRNIPDQSIHLLLFYSIFC